MLSESAASKFKVRLLETGLLWAIQVHRNQHRQYPEQYSLGNSMNSVQPKHKEIPAKNGEPVPAILAQAGHLPPCLNRYWDV